MSANLQSFEPDPGPDTEPMFVHELHELPEMPEMPLHAPVLRSDVPLEAERVQVDIHTDWPTEPINTCELANGQTIQQPMPPACGRISIDGEHVAAAICVGTLLTIGVIALVSSFSNTDLLAYLLEGLQ